MRQVHLRASRKSRGMCLMWILKKEISVPNGSFIYQIYFYKFCVKLFLSVVTCGCVVLLHYALSGLS